MALPPHVVRDLRRTSFLGKLRESVAKMGKCMGVMGVMTFIASLFAPSGLLWGVSTQAAYMRE